MLFIKVFYMLLCLLRPSYARADHYIAGATIERVKALKQNPREIQSCTNRLNSRNQAAANPRNRVDAFDGLRNKQACSFGPIGPRDVSPLDIDHYSHDPNARIDGDPYGFFNDTSSCMLQPDVDPGSFYTNEEQIKFILREAQPGLNMILDIQIVDSSTCEPIPGILVDIWHCNATGVYSSIVAEGNGNSNDLENEDTSYFRGIRPTRADGVAKFGTVIPGHYQNRTNHVNFLTRAAAYDSNNVSLGSNSTTITASHVGQIFFDQALIDTIEWFPPYKYNTQPRTPNKEDAILRQQALVMDPIVEYFWVDTAIAEQGIVAWITIGIDPANRIEVPIAQTNYGEQVGDTDSSGISVVPVASVTELGGESLATRLGSAVSTTTASSGAGRLGTMF